VTVSVNGPSLRRFYAAALQAVGVPSEHAEVVADGVYYADERGLDSHGAQCFLRIYLRMAEAGEVDAAAVPVIATDHQACATVDGRNAFGFVVGRFAMAEAIARARRHGVGAIAVRRSSHAGAMGFYSRAARDAGMIAMSFTNLGRQGMVPPPGGRVPLVGTNVIAVAAPADTEVPFGLDMSTAVVSAGRVRVAARQGRALPPGWLADPEGRDVVDPAALDRGEATLRFLGGGVETGAHKGFGLALFVDVLCGLLAGAGVGPTADKLEPPPATAGRADADIGHFFIALQIAAFGEEARFRARMDEMLGTVRRSSPADPEQSVTYPGMPEAATLAERARTGVPFEPSLLAAIEQTAARLGVAPPERQSACQSACQSAAVNLVE